MPFKSEKQKRYMFSQHPDIANRWVAEEKAKAKKEKRMPKYVVAKSAFGVEHVESSEDVSKAGFSPLFRLGAAGAKEANAAAGGVRAAAGAKDMSSVDTSAKSIMDSVRRAKAKANPQPGSDLVPVGGARTKAEPIQRTPGKNPGKEVVPVGKPYAPQATPESKALSGVVVGRGQGPRVAAGESKVRTRREFKLNVNNPLKGKGFKNPLAGKKLKNPLAGRVQRTPSSAPKSIKNTPANSVDAALLGGGLVGASVLGASAMNNRQKVGKSAGSVSAFGVDHGN